MSPWPILKALQNLWALRLGGDLHSTSAIFLFGVHCCGDRHFICGGWRLTS